MSNKNPLTGATDSDLANAVQENLFALFQAIAETLPGGELVQNEQLSYHHAFPSSPMFKGVWRARLDAVDADATIENTLAWFQKRDAPFVFWWLGPGKKPVDLPDRLQAHGFTPNIIGDPGMAADLHILNENIRTPVEFHIRQPVDQKGLEDWRDVFCAAYDIPLWAGQAWVDATLKVGPASAPWKLYVGYLDDKPVATNILFTGVGVASVYGVGTIPEARGKSIGAAITLKPLLDARKQGYRYAVLYSTEMGHSVYKRLGFYDVDCKIGRYLWVNKAV